jgi:hypothetical protein
MPTSIKFIFTGLIRRSVAAASVAGTKPNGPHEAAETRGGGGGRRVPARISPGKRVRRPCRQG